MAFIAALGMLLCLAFSAKADPLDAWVRLPRDKRLHVGVSAGIAGVPTFAMFALSSHPKAVPHWQKLATAGGVCAAAGLGKEALDEIEYRGADAEDLAADAVGCAAGLAVGAAAGLGASGIVGLAVGSEQVVVTVRF